MTKRFLALFLMCILAIPILAVPVSASGYNGTGAYDFDIWDELVGFRGLFNEFAIQIFPDIMDDLSEQLALWESGMHQAFSALGSNIEIYLKNTAASINNKLSEVKTEINGLGDKITNHTNQMITKLDQTIEVIGTNFANAVTSLLNQWQTWHDQIKAHLTSLLGASEDQKQNASDLEQEVGQQGTEFDEMTDVMATAPTVSNDDIFPEIDYVINEYSTDDKYLSVLGQFYMADVYFIPISLSIAFALMGFILLRGSDMQTLISFIQSIGEAIATGLDFVISFFSDFIQFISLIAEMPGRVAQALKWLPANFKASILIIFTVVILYKICGREG